jgi:hypothetical protein
LSFAICLSRWLNLDFRILAAVSSAIWASGVKQAAKALAASTSFAVFFVGSLAIAEVPNATMTADMSRRARISGALLIRIILFNWPFGTVAIW